MSRTARALRACLRPALLFGFGLGVSLAYGRRGFMPLDQSIVFDGGWRVLCGQLPFRDYVAPNGFVVHALQAAFFAVGGVSWLVYCLHAAVLNGAFAIVVDRCLRGVGASAGIAFGCGAASALVLTPPVGVPYMDSHAFFFSLVAVWLAVEARRRESALTWMAVPGALLLAALSKQVPSVFALPLVVAIAVDAPWPRAARRLRWLAVGSLAALVGLALVGALLGVEPALVARYFFALPADELPRRLADLPAAFAIVARDFRALGVVSVVTVPAALLAGFALASPGTRRRALRPLALAAGLVALSVAFAVVTLNQVALALPPLFLAVGLAALGLQRLAGAARAGGRASAARPLALLLLAAALFDAWRFHDEVNRTRSANDMRFDAAVAARADGTLPAALSFLAWQVPRVVPYGADDLREVAAFLSAQPEGFLLIGDASILYGITGKPSAAPALWIHPGLTMPRPDDPAFSDYEEWLLARMDALAVRYLVLEGRQTWNHTTLDDFPRLARRVRAKKTPRLHFGAFRIVDLGTRSEPGDPRPQAATRSPRRTSASESALPRAASLGAS